MQTKYNDVGVLRVIPGYLRDRVGEPEPPIFAEWANVVRSKCLPAASRCAR